MEMEIMLVFFSGILFQGPQVTDERDESTSAQPLDLSRHAQTETWGEYSQIHVQSADNTFTPWKLSSFSIFPT